MNAPRSGRIARFLVPMLLALPAGRASDLGEFRPLFDGESLAGWTAIGSKPGNWRVEGGLLVTRGDGKGWLSTNRAYGDFEMGLEYRIGPSGNSGVLIRAPHRGDPSYEGLEIQILDDDAPAYRNLAPAQYCGSVYGVLASRRGLIRPPGLWNSLLIRAEGPTITVWLNGVMVTHGEVAGRSDLLPRHQGIRRPAGFVGLQSHADPVQFRRVVIREIRPSGHGAPAPSADPAARPGG